MELKEIGVNMRKWVYSAKDRVFESPWECSIGPSGSIRHGINLSECTTRVGNELTMKTMVLKAPPIFSSE